jgi:ribosomal protein S18 acetylase RimI-like enzyme
MGVVRIRPAAEADWRSIWPFWRDIVAGADTYAYPAELDSDAARALWFATPPSETWVAEVDGGGEETAAGSDIGIGTDAGTRVVGTYHLGPNHSGPGSHVANASYMVDADARGQGVGRALVVHSLERAREAGYRGIQFNAVAETNLAAVRLYLDLGFSTIGRVPGGFRHPELGYVDLLIMFRAL